MNLVRYCYGEDCTKGRLSFGDTVLHTLERPWVPGMRGGMPFVSCVPDGEYQLLRHARPNGDVVLALRNPDLGVFYSKASMEGEGRYLILIHAANYVSQIQGCIAPGIGQTISDNRQMVTSSRNAMEKIMAHWETHRPQSITIEPTRGTD